MAKKAVKLTGKQKRFIQEYLVDLNATRAAKDAGYSEKTAYRTGADNLRKPQIADAIDKAMQKRGERTEINQDYVVNTIVETIERCKQAKPVVGRNGQPLMVEQKDGTMAFAYTFEPNAILKGTDQLGKHLGMFVTKHEVTGKNGEAIVFKSVIERIWAKNEAEKADDE